jgi:hypothetical protein
MSANGHHVHIHWERRARRLSDAPPPGGGVYVVFRDGRPEAVHLTDDFRDHFGKRYGADPDHPHGNEHEYEGEAEGFLRGRGRRSGGGGRRRRWARFGRVGGSRHMGRFGRIHLLRSLRQSMQPPPDQDDSDDDGSDDQNAQG